MAREPREQLVVDLLTDQWNSSNTHGLTPSIIYASQDEPDSPHITVEQFDEGPINGGETGFDGRDATGGVPHQTISGTVPVHAYASDDELSGATTDAAAVYMTGTGQSGGSVDGGVVDEIQRIIRENAVQPTNPNTGNQPVQLLAPTAFRPGPTDEPEQVHYIGQVQYIYSTA